MKLTVNIPSEVEEPLNEKCQKTQKEPSELVELLLEWYFLKRKKPEINEIGNANDLLKMADYCAKERMYNCRYSEVDRCTREVEIHKTKKPKPLHPYMCLFCSQFEDKREENGGTEQKEDKNQNAIDEHKIARIAAGIIMEKYGNKLDKSNNASKDNDKSNEHSNEEDKAANHLNFSEFEEEIEEEPEEELITKDKVEKLLDDW